MTTYHTLITNNGKAQIANAINTNTKVAITHLAVGDGRGATPTPNTSATRLVAEKARVAVNHVGRHATNANWVEVHATIPSSTGGFTVREIGLYAGTTLIAVGSFPATYKPSATEGGDREMSIKLIIAVENASIVNVTLDDSLVYATRKWVEDNFVNHDEVIDNLSSTETTKPLSAHQGKVLNDKITTADGYIHQKADKSTAITAGAGLTGGGNLQGNRTLSLGTPSKITANSINTAVSNTHSHEIDKASTTLAGIVQLNDTLASTSTNQALTANQGKVLNDGKLGNQGHQTLAGRLNITNSEWAKLHFPLSDGSQWFIEANPNYKTAQNGGLAIRFMHDNAGTKTFYDLVKSDKNEIIAYQSWVNGELAKKANASHRHNWNDIDGKPSTYPPATHSHAWSQITGVPSASTTAQGIIQLNDTLTSTATNQALTAAQGKILNDKIAVADGYIHAKADKSTAITAGAGLTGGGNLQGNRTLSLGTPSKITANSINTAVSNTHSHEIDKASTTVAGIVQLNDTLASTSTNQALTANQGKVLNDKIDNKSNFKTINWVADKSSNYQLTGFYRGNSQPLDGINTSSLEMHITHPEFGGNAYARGVGFDYGSTGFGIYTHAWDAEGRHLGRKIILTEDNGVMKSGDTMTGVLTLNNQRWPKLQLASNQGDQALLLESGGTDGTHCLIVRPHTDGVVSGSNIARFNLPTTTGTKTLATEDGNVASATRIQTTRNIAMTGDGTWNVNFDGSGNATGVMTLANTGVRAGSYNSVTVDAKGRVTAGLTQTHGLVTATSATGTTNTATTNTNTFLNIVASGVRQTASVGSSTQITGTNGISVSSDTAGKVIITRDGNSPTATRLQTARQIALTGAVTGNVNFDGSGNVNIGTALNLTEFANLKAENGYQRLPNGLILQWGKLASDRYLGESAQSITFPISFPTACLNVQANMYMTRHSALGDGGVFVVDFDRSTANFSLQNIGTNSVGDLRGFYWFAIGY